MLYAILCYHDEDVVNAWSQAEDDAVLAKRSQVTDPLAAAARLGPAVRLMPTTAAVTVRSGADPVVIDGPFAETKEQLLGFYIVDCATLEEAVEVARRMGVGETGAFEIRPVKLHLPSRLDASGA
ncbi:MAG: YciI family protein [Rhodospirillales bacterium]|nr:YciI family protein [Rhodospirillales bacterium]MBN8898629.1 YciI family protein [Rhodospirillales bacterium]